MGHLKVINDIKLILNDQGGHSDSYRNNHSGPSEVPYSQNEELVVHFFVALLYSLKRMLVVVKFHTEFTQPPEDTINTLFCVFFSLHLT